MSIAVASMPSGEERAIPFLRNLTAMLENNSEYISFVPGMLGTSRITPGKIVIHNRNLLQEEILPIYFNHKSFASLRRQLSYFSFIRCGKASEGKISYANDTVFELADILRLKRRSSSSSDKNVSQEKQLQEKKPADPQLNTSTIQDKNHMLTSSANNVVSAVNSGMLHAAKSNDSVEAMKKCPEAVASTDYRASTTPNSSLSNSSGNEAKKKLYKKTTSSLPLQKIKLRKKDRARLKKMLRYNSIVPFVHLPEMPMMVEVDNNRDSSESDLADSDEKCTNKKIKSKPPNDTAANALLSLRST
jgi:hypothetical protein